jgi:hypothetical protein
VGHAFLQLYEAGESGFLFLRLPSYANQNPVMLPSICYKTEKAIHALFTMYKEHKAVHIYDRPQKHSN